MRSSEAGQIGHVAAVDSDTLTVELDPSVTGMVKAGPTGVASVGRINSYVTVQAGQCTIVAVVTSIRVFPDQDADTSSPGVRRTIEAVMVGRFESGKYSSGITTFPSLFEPVLPATDAQVEAIFEPHGESISLGRSVVVPDLTVRLDANKLLGRHVAVLGTTGAGKSCTLTAMLDGLLGLHAPYANIVIFDANGEYARAFSSETDRGQLANACVIGPTPGEPDGLFVPHWFMNNEDHLDLLRASEGTQAPLLLRAIADARLVDEEELGFALQLRQVKRAIDDLASIVTASTGRKPQELIAQFCTTLTSSLQSLQETAEGERAALWRQMVDRAEAWEDIDLQVDAWDLPISLSQRRQLDEVISSLRAIVSQEMDQLGLGSASVGSDFDVPHYYDLDSLYDVHLPARVEAASATDPKTRAYVTPLMMRLGSLLADSRYNFMTRVPRFDDSLSRYLRYILGWEGLSEEGGSDDRPWKDAYEEQRRDAGPSRPHSVTIIDLSLIASDVLEAVTGLLARLILEFAQRVEPRAAMPILIVLEEAHRYIPAHREGDSEPRSAEIFDRIAREGRKYGVSLMLASQRPSELSRTVLSQCGTLVAHRMLNPDDQNLVRHATPFAAREVLRQLPGLATQHAVVLGEAVPAPSYVKVNRVKNPPHSDDPDFVLAWREGPTPSGEQLIGDVARTWQASTQMPSTAEEPEPETSVAEEASDEPPF